MRDEYQTCNEEEHQQLQCGSYSVGEEVPDPGEDGSGDEDAVDNRRQTRLRQDDVCCRPFVVIIIQ